MENRVLLISSTPAVIPNAFYFQPFGHSVARDLSSAIPSSPDWARILVLGCSDLRHVLFTVFSRFGIDDGPQCNDRLAFTLNDLEPAVLARCVFLLHVILESDALQVAHRAIKVKASDAHHTIEHASAWLGRVWSSFYNVLIDEETYALVQSSCLRLLEVSDTAKAWAGSRIGALVFMDPTTRAAVRAMLRAYSVFQTDTAKYTQERALYYSTHLTAAEEANPNIVPLVMIGSTTLFANRHAEYGSLDDYMQTGRMDAETVLLSSSAGCIGRSDQQLRVNPLLALTEHAGKQICMHPLAFPPLGFHLDNAFYQLIQPLADGIVNAFPSALFKPLPSQLSPTHAELARLSVQDWTDLALRACLGELAQWFLALQKHTDRLCITCMVGDAIDCCDLQRAVLESAGVSSTEPSSSPSMGPSLIGVSSHSSTKHELATNKPPFTLRTGPGLYDAVDVADIGEHVGGLNIVLAALPLLDPNSPFSRLYSEVKVRLQVNFLHDSQAEILASACQKLFLMQPETAGMLLGISPESAHLPSCTFSYAGQANARRTAVKNGICPDSCVNPVRVSWQFLQPQQQAMASSVVHHVVSPPLAPSLEQFYELVLDVFSCLFPRRNDACSDDVSYFGSTAMGPRRSLVLGQYSWVTFVRLFHYFLEVRLRLIDASPHWTFLYSFDPLPRYCDIDYSEILPVVNSIRLCVGKLFDTSSVRVSRMISAPAECHQVASLRVLLTCDDYPWLRSSSMQVQDSPGRLLTYASPRVCISLRKDHDTDYCAVVHSADTTFVSERVPHDPSGVYFNESSSTLKFGGKTFYRSHWHDPSAHLLVTALLPRAYLAGSIGGTAHVGVHFANQRLAETVGRGCKTAPWFEASLSDRSCVQVTAEGDRASSFLPGAETAEELFPPFAILAPLKFQQLSEQPSSCTTSTTGEPFDAPSVSFELVPAGGAGAATSFAFPGRALPVVRHLSVTLTISPSLLQRLASALVFPRVVRGRSMFAVKLMWAGGAGATQTSVEVLFPLPVSVQSSVLRISRTRGTVQIVTSPCYYPQAQECDLPSTLLPAHLCSSPGGSVAAGCLPRVRLQSLPALSQDELNMPLCLSLLCHLVPPMLCVPKDSFFNFEEPYLALLNNISSLCKKYFDSPLNTLPLVIISESPPEKSLALLYLNTLRLDFSRSSLVIDACVCVLEQAEGKEQNILAAMMSAAPKTSKHIACCPFQGYPVIPAEWELWKQLIARGADSCAPAPHHAACSARSAGRGSDFLCSCRLGAQLPWRFTSQLPPALSRYFQRIAIPLLFGTGNVIPVGIMMAPEAPFTSPPMSVRGATGSACTSSGPQAVESRAPVERRCSEPSCTRTDALSMCARCHIVYCSRECQRRHWKQGGHREACQPQVTE